VVPAWLLLAFKGRGGQPLGVKLLATGHRQQVAA